MVILAASAGSGVDRNGGRAAATEALWVVGDFEFCLSTEGVFLYIFCFLFFFFFLGRPLYAREEKRKQSRCETSSVVALRAAKRLWRNTKAMRAFLWATGCWVCDNSFWLTPWLNVDCSSGGNKKDGSAASSYVCPAFARMHSGRAPPLFSLSFPLSRMMAASLLWVSNFPIWVPLLISLFITWEWKLLEPRFECYAF